MIHEVIIYELSDVAIVLNIAQAKVARHEFLVNYDSLGFKALKISRDLSEGPSANHCHKPYEKRHVPFI